MKRSLKITLAVIGTIVFGAGCFVCGYFTRNLTTPDYASIDFILRYYKKYYLEEDEDYVALMANGLLAKDVYSQYYTRSDYEMIEILIYDCRIDTYRSKKEMRSAKKERNL